MGWVLPALNWFGAEWHKVVGALTAMMIWIVHGEEIIEKVERVFGLRKFITRRIEERRHKMNFVSGLLLAESEAVKISAFIEKIPTYLPLIQQNIADLQKAAADKSNPAAEMEDVSALLNDLNSDLTLLLSVAPALKPTTPPPPAAA